LICRDGLAIYAVAVVPVWQFGTVNLGAGGSDRNLDDLGTDRLNFNGVLKDIQFRKPGFAVPDAFIGPVFITADRGKKRQLAKERGTGPSFYTFDLNVTSEWKLGERTKLRPVIEFDNILNAAVFQLRRGIYRFPGPEFFSNGGPVVGPAKTFLSRRGRIGKRQIRLGMRIDF